MAAIGAFELATVELGMRLGLYQSLADDGPATPPQLAARTGIDARYAREWLEQQATAGIVAIDADAVDGRPRQPRVLAARRAPGVPARPRQPGVRRAAAPPSPSRAAGLRRRRSSTPTATGTGICFGGYGE